MEAVQSWSERGLPCKVVQYHCVQRMSPKSRGELKREAGAGVEMALNLQASGLIHYFVKDITDGRDMP